MGIRSGVLLSCALLAAVGGSSAAGAPAKPAIRGLVSMGAYRFVSEGGDPVNTLAPLNAKPGIFGGIVIVATWRQLQPSGPSDFESAAIDSALADVLDYNAANPERPLAVKLRVWGGFEAPEWAMQLKGKPIDVVDNGTPRVIGHFWRPAYRQAWANLQALLAAKYDADPLIREVSVTSCMSFTAEPFFIPTEDSVQQPLRAAGFKDAMYRTCLENAVSDYGPWQATRIVLAVNPLRTAADQGKGDVAFTRRVMRACRAALGERCVFDNHDLDADPASSIGPIYRTMKALGPEIEFQTFHETPSNFTGTIRKGVALGASSIELWQDFGGFPLVPDATLMRWAEWLESGVEP